ncbi:hypothetical protein FNU79_17490 [Deinococcus detaillensis]|uniref:Uncharacterized protein n=1 Tax=Deinococcus detaillensis TaxID=2592048 RepID=A0A553UHY7_9DEIO|nr:hypothetical protein [Deinococcus detaillensis]TSA79776.1 hypothetical protein FNU79_17490 [Deinococcus detaillensis]
MSTAVIGVIVVALIIIVTIAMLLMLAVHNPSKPEETELPKYRMMHGVNQETPTWKEPGEE